MTDLSIYVLNGLSYGMLLFIIASGLSLIFGVMGTLNLAHGALYVLGAYIGYTLARAGANFFVAALVAGVCVGIVGIILDRVFLRRLYKQMNEQVLLTLGVVYILWNIFIWVWGPITTLGRAPAIFQGGFELGDLTYPIYRMAILLIGLIIFACLWLLQEKTKIGAMIRAGMDDKQMTMGMGVNYALISSFVFFLGSFLGGLAGYLGTPVIGIAPGISLDILLLAIIVIVVGGVGNIQGALLGAVIIGLIDSFGKAFFPDMALFTMYLAMIIILLIRPFGILGRPQFISGDGSADLPSLPAATPLTSGEKMAKYGIYIIIAAVILLLPLFGFADIRNMFGKLIVLAIFALSLNLVFGYAGLLSLGHAAYFGIAAYTAAVLERQFGIESFWLLLLAGIVAATVLSAIFGIIALRVSGVYFLLVTLALGQLIWSVALSWRGVTGGHNGLAGIFYPDIGIPGLALNSTSYHYLEFAFFLICLYVMYRIVKSPFGRALQGIRGDEQRMKSLGYNTWLYKYLAFIIGGLFAGVAGVLYAFHTGIVGLGFVQVLMSATVLLMIIIGSPNVFWGPIIGAALIVIIEYFASIYIPARWPLVLGAIFILSVTFLRGGVALHLLRLLGKVRKRFGTA